MHRWCLHGLINLMEQLDMLPIQSKYIEHMHDGVWFRKSDF